NSRWRDSNVPLKTLRAFIIVSLLAVRALSGEIEIEFSGVMAADGRTKFAFTDKSAGTARWIEVGGSIAGFTLTAYDSKEEVATLTKDGAQLRLHLVSAKVHSSTEISEENRQAILANLQKIVAAAYRYNREN